MVRVKYRYLLCEIVCQDFLLPTQLKLSIVQQDILKSVQDSIYLMYGDYGAGVTYIGLTIKMYNPITRIFLLRAKRVHHTIVSASLPFIQKIGTCAVSVRLLHLGGTIRTCLGFLQKFDHEQLVLLKARCKNETEKVNVDLAIKKSYKVLGVEDDSE